MSGTELGARFCPGEKALNQFGDGRWSSHFFAVPLLQFRRNLRKVHAALL